MKKIAFVTSEKFPELSADDRLVIPLLAERDIEVQPAVWTNETVNWREFDAVIIRSCWDYHLKYERFRRWIDQLESAAIPLWNPAKILRWNADKIYLQDLEARGISIVPTIWLKNSPDVNLAATMEALGWKKAVLKPAVSASAFQTRLLTTENAASETTVFADAEQNGRLFMMQPFMEEVAATGEWSLVFFRRQFSHAVLKTPQTGDFRVQQEYGGAAERQTPSQNMIKDAFAVLDAVDAPILYARVDGVEVNQSFVLMELELIEPFLFLASDPAAPEKFAAAIQSFL